MSSRRATGRPLTGGEAALAASLFGRALDPALVRLHHRRWWPLQPKGCVMAPDGDIWFRSGDGLWREDYALAERSLTGLFVHELTHVWQHQRGLFLPLRRHPFCRYAYTLVPGRPLARYGIEQQAEIVRHAWAAQTGARPPDPALEALLPVHGDGQHSP